MEFLFTADNLIALLTLTFLEIVLGIDNVIFISIITDRLPQEKQKFGRLLGLALAMLMRIILLLLVNQLTGLTNSLFSIFEVDITGKGLILIAGGLFLLVKSTLEIHKKVEFIEHQDDVVKTEIKMSSALLQIVLLDLVFSFDSILTAVGLTKEVGIMIIAVLISLVIMMIFANKISDFINKHPSLQLLALSFLILIGFMLLLEGFHIEVPKGYIYFAVLFSFLIELLNMRFRANRKERLAKKKRKA